MSTIEIHTSTGPFHPAPHATTHDGIELDQINEVSLFGDGEITSVVVDGEPLTADALAEFVDRVAVRVR